MRWDRLAEHQIQKARAEGQLDELKGAGKPLPKSATTGDAATDAGFRIMADAGAVPEEVHLRKKIESLTAELHRTPSGQARKDLQARLADLQMRLAIEEEIRRRTFR